MTIYEGINTDLEDRGSPEYKKRFIREVVVSLTLATGLVIGGLFFWASLIEPDFVSHGVSEIEAKEQAEQKCLIVGGERDGQSEICPLPQ